MQSEVKAKARPWVLKRVGSVKGVAAWEYKTGSLGDGSPLAGSRGRARVGELKGFL